MLNNLDEIKKYIPAKLSKGISTEIVYSAFNPETGKLDRKRIRINHVKKASERYKYANELIRRLNENLASGWNPFIDPESKKSFKRLSEAVDHFLNIAEKKLSDGLIRPDTYKDYVSYLRNLQKWLDEKKIGDIYLYKLDKKVVSDFLEHIYVERDNTSRTRNNYLNLLRVFAGFLIEKDYTKIMITDGVNPLPKGKKQRTVIKQSDLKKIREYLEKENKYFLFACEFLYFTFIRPNEMTLIQIKLINFAKKTIFIPADISKNKKDGTITIPNSLGQMMIDLKIYEYPSEFYLFSDHFKPGEKLKSEKMFRDYWLPMRRKLKLPETYHFYSLKDTGITDLLTNTGDPLLVRDQARHSSISITDIYTPHDQKEANQKIITNDLRFGE